MPAEGGGPTLLVVAKPPVAATVRWHVESEGLADVAVETAGEAALERLRAESADCLGVASDLPPDPERDRGTEWLTDARDRGFEGPAMVFDDREDGPPPTDGGTDPAPDGGVTERVAGDGPEAYATAATTVLEEWMDRGLIPRSESVDRSTTELFERSPDPVARYGYVDGEPVLVDANTAFEAAFGCTTGDVRGAPIDDVVLTVGEGTAHADLLGDRSVEAELRCRTIDGVRTYLLRSTGDPDGGYVIYTEISDYKSVEQRFSSLVKSSSDVLFILGTDGTVEYVSPAVEETFGYRPPQLQGESVLEWIHPEDRERVVEQLFADPMSWTGETRSVTYRFRTDEGDWRVVDSGARSRIYDPAVEGIVVSCRDVTDRERRKQELQRFETIAETVPVGAMVIDDEEHIEWINERGASLIGTGPDDLVGRPFEDLIEWGVVGRDLAEAHADAVTRLLGSESNTARSVYETAATTLDGERRHIDVHVGLLPTDDGYQGTVSIFQDITERTEYERKLARLHEATRSLMGAETAQEVARKGIDAAKEVLGIRLAGIHFLDEEREQLEPVATTSEAVETFEEVPTLSAGDSVAWEAFEMGDSLLVDDVHDRKTVANPDTPIRSELIIPLGEHGVLLAAAEDAGWFSETDRSLAEVLAANVQRGLDRAEREQELKRQNERLDRFASFVSHDLRNPLNVANGYLETAIETDDTVHLHDVRHSLDRMEQLIEELLTMARQGDEVDEPEPVDLESVWRDACSTVDTGGLTTTVEDTATVLADEPQLRQLFENLVRNATEHAGQRPHVWIGTTDDGFYVEDDGPGIDAEDRETVFEEGYTTRAEGTGFGLEIVSGIVDAHGWSIDVVEGRAGGARFEVTDVEFHEEEAGGERFEFTPGGDFGAEFD